MSEKLRKALEFLLMSKCYVHIKSSETGIWETCSVCGAYWAPGDKEWHRVPCGVFAALKILEEECHETPEE